MKKASMIVLLAAVSTASATELLSQPQPAPNCDPTCQAKWSIVTGEFLGVFGRDPVGEVISGKAAKKFGWVLGRNWYSMTLEKEVLCGSLEDYRWFVGIKFIPPFRDDENDRNLYLVPTPGVSRSLFEHAKNTFTKPGKIKICNGKECFETEVTPHHGLFGNQYFPRPKNARRRMKTFPKGVPATTPLRGSDICFYGSWVFEEAHGNRPEVHPAELAWWRDRNAGYHFVVVQDDSERFDRKRNYKKVKGQPYDPVTWQPWSRPPREAEFEVAFSVPKSQTLNYEILHEDDRNVITNAGGGPYAYSSGNTKVVVHVPSHGDYLDVSFSGLHWYNNHLRGYVVIREQVGVDDRRREGFHVFVMREVGAGLPAPAAMAAAAPKAEVERIVSMVGVSESLRSEESSGSDKLFGDLDYRIEWEDGHYPPPDFEVAEVYLLDSEENRTQELTVDHQLQASSGHFEGTVRRVPVLDGVELEFVEESGDSLFVWVPALELDATVARKPITEAAPDGSWPGAVSLFGRGARSKSGESPAEFRQAPQWLVEVKPRYVGATADTYSPFSELLDEALQEESQELVEVSRSVEFLKADWEYDMTNQTRDARVSLNRIEEDPKAAATPEFPAVEELSTALPGTKFRVWFADDPSDTDVYEIVARGTVRDVFGNQVEVEWTLENYVLYSPDVEEVVKASLEVAMDLQDLPEESVSSLRRSSEAIGAREAFKVSSPEPWDEDYSRAKREAQLIALASYVAQDNVADFAELERVAEAARLLAESE